MTNVGHNERHYRVIKVQRRDLARQLGEGCALWMFNPDCPRAIDHTLDHRDPYAYCTDHIVPRAHGGPPDAIENMQPAHRICNEKRGDRPMPATTITDTYSEEWPT